MNVYLVWSRMSRLIAIFKRRTAAEQFIKKYKHDDPTLTLSRWPVFTTLAEVTWKTVVEEQKAKRSIDEDAIVTSYTAGLADGIIDERPVRGY